MEQSAQAFHPLPIERATLPAAALAPETDGRAIGNAGRLVDGPQERPLFSISRRPPPQSPNPAQPLAPAVGEPRGPLLSLVDAIAGESDEFAIFLDEKTKAVVRLKTGESHSGWTLRQVRGREATLRERERGSRHREPAGSLGRFPEQCGDFPSTSDQAKQNENALRTDPKAR